MLQIRCDTKIENHISNFAEIKRRVLYWRNGIINIYIHQIEISVIVPFSLEKKIPTNNANVFEMNSFF